VKQILYSILFVTETLIFNIMVKQTGVNVIITSLKLCPFIIIFFFLLC